MQNFRTGMSYLLISFLCLTEFIACSTVRSVVPGMKDDSSDAAKAGEKLHFKISPQEAVVILGEVAPQHGWQLVSTGDQFDLQGLRGKYFRLATNRFIGGLSEVNGVFFSEPTGTYVIVGKKDTGLPEELTGPFMAAVEAHTGTAGEP